MTSELEEMHNLLHVETENRKQFEEQLKRVFLKNLTHMNMEAYALFNTNNDINNSLDAMVDNAASHSMIAPGSVMGVGMDVEPPSVVKRPAQPSPSPSATTSVSDTQAPRVVVTKHNTPISALQPHVSIASTTRSARVQAGGKVNKNPPNSVLRKSIRPNTGQSGPTSSTSYTSKSTSSSHTTSAGTSAMRSSMENVVPRANAPPMPMHYPHNK